MYSNNLQEKYLLYCDTFDKYETICRNIDNEFLANDKFIKEYFLEIYKNLQTKLDRRNYHVTNKNNIDLIIYEEYLEEDRVEKLLQDYSLELKQDYDGLENIYQSIKLFMKHQEDCPIA